MSNATMGFVRLFRDLIVEFALSFLMLVEFHISGPKTTKVIGGIVFDGQFIQEAICQFGGIWCFGDTSVWDLDVTTYSFQLVHMKLR